MVIINIFISTILAISVFISFKSTFVGIQKRRYLQLKLMYSFILSCEWAVTTYMSFTDRYLSSQDHKFTFDVFINNSLKHHYMLPLVKFRIGNNICKFSK